MSETPGTIREGEYHPAAGIAMKFYRDLSIEDKATFRESFASTALSGNRLSEICLETMDRLDSGKPVSDRYLLGLCVTMNDILYRIGK